MTGVLALAVGALYAVGVYLLLQRSLTQIVMGLALLGHGANLLLLMVGGPAGDAPVIHEDVMATPAEAGLADPLPQALALTAIVISFGITAYLLALAWRRWSAEGNDEVEDDLEDRRVARQAAGGAAGLDAAVEEGA